MSVSATITSKKIVFFRCVSPPPPPPVVIVPLLVPFTFSPFPLVQQQQQRPVYQPNKKESVCIVLPPTTADTVVRTKILEIAVESNPGMFILSVPDTTTNDKETENDSENDSDTESDSDPDHTHMKRYLLSCSVPSEKITKMHANDCVSAIVESLELIGLLSYKCDIENIPITFACDHSTINTVQKSIKMLRENNTIPNRKFTYLCPFV